MKGFDFTLTSLKIKRYSAITMANHLSYWEGKVFMIILLILMSLMASACERDTKLVIKGNNPPDFVLSGSGSLGALRVRGPKVQRQAIGEDASVYWEIEPKEVNDLQNVEQLSPITYGKVPPGYVQVYPERGEAPPLIEGERYNIRVATNNANGADTYFTIRNGKAVEESISK